MALKLGSLVPDRETPETPNQVPMFVAKLYLRHLAMVSPINDF